MAGRKATACTQCKRARSRCVAPEELGAACARCAERGIHCSLLAGQAAVAPAGSWTGGVASLPYEGGQRTVGRGGTHTCTSDGLMDDDTRPVVHTEESAAGSSGLMDGAVPLDQEGSISLGTIHPFVDIHAVAPRCLISVADSVCQRNEGHRGRCSAKAARESRSKDEELWFENELLRAAGSWACSLMPALIRLLSPACSPPPALPRLLSSACSPLPASPALLPGPGLRSGMCPLLLVLSQALPPTAKRRIHDPV